MEKWEPLKTVMGATLFELLPFTSENLRFLMWQVTVIVAGVQSKKPRRFFFLQPLTRWQYPLGQCFCAAR